MPHHPHQHSVKTRSSAPTLDQAVTKALEGLADPAGHHAGLSFRTFEVVEIGGHFGTDGRPVVDVTIEAFGTHKD